MADPATDPDTSGDAQAKPNEPAYDATIYTYEAMYPLYALGFCNRTDVGHRFMYAAGSIIEEYKNKVQILQLNADEGVIEKRHEFEHPYPTTRIMFEPMREDKPGKNLLATTGDYLRLWNVTDDGVRMEAMFLNNKHTEYCAPVTSFDWPVEDTGIIGTSSIDTTCTIWDLEKQRARTQLIAHDKEVYDIRFRNKNVFCTVGGDGSLRLFDLRSLEHSTIMYETSDSASEPPVPLLRLAWNQQDSHYIATFAMDSNEVILLDIRAPAVPAVVLRSHTAALNGVEWAPHSSCHICSVGDDTQALIWDVSACPDPVEDPILAYKAPAEINQMIWPRSEPEWVVIAYDHSTQLLRV